MGACSNCCCCWWKRKPTETTLTADPAVSPRIPSPQDIQTTSLNPSTDSSNQPQIVISHTQPSSTTPPQPSTSKKPPPTLQEVIGNFEKIDIKSQADVSITAIKEYLERNTAQKHTQDTDKLSKLDPYIQSGGKFLKFVNDHTEEMKIDTKDSFFQSGEATEIIGKILQQIGHVHWAVAGISIVGYLVSKCAKVSANRTECVELLKEMLTLVCHIKDLNENIIEEKEKFEDAFDYIIKGSMSCASQIDSGKIFRFLKSSVNSGTLTAIRSKISAIYRDLTLTATRKIIRQKTIHPPLLPQDYPSYAVGIEGQLKAVNKLLNMENTEDCSSFAVVIWGFGGIGKTTIAEAVVSTVDRNRYNYARIQLDEVSEKNKYKEMQQQILKDAFPRYKGGRKIELRDDADGRDHLTQAFRSGADEPVFLVIDNALHKEDLENILPKDLKSLPQRSRILITTRILKETDVLEERALRRQDYHVKTLSDNHARTILCNGPAIPDGIKDDLEDIIKICNGIPLVLKIVSAHLRKMKYEADRCTQILGALRRGEKIKEDKLTDRLFDFVYSRLEDSTQEAFLDICCFFHKDYLRRHVEYIVGDEEVTYLVDAALITTVMREDKEMMSVHDILRSIGRRMSKLSRIMDVNSWVEAENDEAKLKGIKGVWLKNEACMLEKRHLQSMKNTLRILAWEGRMEVRATDAVTLPELRCIITDCDISGPSVEVLNKLAFLDCEKLPTKQGGHLKLPESLRWIRARRQPVETQDLPKTGLNSSLKELYIYFLLSWGLSNEEKDNSKNAFNTFLQGLNKLKHLKVEDCKSLCELPEQVCMLPQLSTLSLEGCRKLERLPELFGKLTALRELDLSWCTSLKELPSAFSELKSLEYINLHGCIELQSDICQRDDNIKIVKTSEHSCTDCQKYKKLRIVTNVQLNAVSGLLNMENTADCSSIAVVIWGLGGIGKTTLAECVVSTVDRDRYNYARIELDWVSEKNNYKEMQEQILKDAFPSYEGGRKIELRDDADGRYHLTQAFQSEANKPVFLFIDDAHKKDLEKVLPDLRGLPHRSRILITTRILKETDVLQERGLQRKDYEISLKKINYF